MTKLKDFLHKRPSAWYMLYIPVYLLLFFIVEQLVPSTCDYWVSYLPLDDLIPFCEYFVVFYCLWYPLLIATAIYLFANDDHSFRLYGWFIIIAFTGTLLFCLIFPNGQNLRPAEFTDSNFFTWLVGRLYHADTNTNVIPSMHVLGCMGRRLWAVPLPLYSTLGQDRRHYPDGAYQCLHGVHQAAQHPGCYHCADRQRGAVLCGIPVDG